MSHFVVGVIVPRSTTSLRIAEQQIEDRLAPFSEHLEVDPYMTHCWCAETEADIAAMNYAAKKTKPLDSFRKEYWDIPEDQRPEFEKFAADFFQAREEYREKHPRHDPVAGCESCHGSGKYETTRNPLAKWDWYQIGGRWTGLWSDYDPQTDTDNIEVCNLCHGTGLRTDKVGADLRNKDPEFTCNGCQGTGKSITWPTDWKEFEGDIQPVEKVIALIEKDVDEYCPFAILTPNGWHERGEMGWFASVSNEKQDWPKECLEVLEKHKELNIVVVDCHT